MPLKTKGGNATYDKEKLNPHSSNTPKFTETVLDTVRQDKGYAIYSYYDFAPNKKAQKSNPFREERTSSFFVRKEGYFKDFGNPDIKGDAIKFIQLWDNCSFSEAIKTAAGIYGITENNNPKGRPEKRKATNRREKKTSEWKLLDIEFCDIHPTLSKYYKRKTMGDIGLILQDAKPVKYFKIKNLSTGDIYEKYPNGKMLSIELIKGEYYKLLQPKEKFWAKGKTSFLGNRDSRPSYSYNLGLDNLTCGLPIIVTEGEADRWAILSAIQRNDLPETNVVTFGSANASLKKLFEQEWVNPDEVFILYDTDFTGIENGLKNAKEYRCKILTLPKLKKQLWNRDKSKNKFKNIHGSYLEKIEPHLAEKPKYNDVCDYLQQYGFDSDLKQCIHVERYLPIKLEVDKYISEACADIDRIIEKYPKLILQSGCGSGKTRFIIEHAKRKEKRLLLTVPYTALTKQIRKQYEKYGVLCIDGESSKEDKEQVQSEQIVVCTYDQLNLLALYFDKENDLLVVDEFHNLTNQLGFRGDANTNVFKASKVFRNTVLLSGTPNLLFQEIGYKLLKISQKEANKVSVKVCRYENNKKAYMIKELLGTPSDKLSIIRCKTVPELKEFKQTLIRMGIDKKEIASIYVHDFLDNCPNWKSLIENNTLPSNIRFLLCTSKINDGVNIENTNIHKVFLYDIFCYDTFVQFVARFREIKELEVILLHSITDNKKPERHDMLQMYMQYKEVAEAESRLFDKQRELQQAAAYFIPENLHSIETRYSNFINSESGEVNFLNVLFAVKEQYISRTTKDMFYKDLDAHEHITVSYGTNIQAKENKIINQVRKEQKEDNKQAEIKIKEILQEKHLQFFRTLFLITKSRPLKKRLREFFDLQSYVPGSKVSFQEEFESLFKQHEKLVYRYADLYLFMFEYLGKPINGITTRSINHDEVIELIFNVKKSKQFKTRIKCAFLLYHYRRNKYGLSPEERKDAMMLLKDIELLKESRILSAGDISKKLNTERYFNIFKLDNRQASERTCILFLNAETKHTNSKNYVTGIDKELNLENLLNYYKINKLRGEAQNYIPIETFKCDSPQKQPKEERIMLCDEIPF